MGEDPIFANKEIKKELYLISSAQLLKLDLKLNLTTSTNYRLHKSSLNPLWVKYLILVLQHITFQIYHTKQKNVESGRNRKEPFSDLSHIALWSCQATVFAGTCWVDTTLGSSNWTVHVIPVRIMQLLDWGDQRPPICIEDPELFIGDSWFWLETPTFLSSKTSQFLLEIPSFLSETPQFLLEIPSFLSESP